MKHLDFRGVGLALMVTYCASAAPPRVEISYVTGRFFENRSDDGAFSATPGTPVIFSQQFVSLNFNPPADAVHCNNPIEINEDFRPFTDVIVRPDGSCSLASAQGNGRAAGVGDLAAFNAVFTGTFTVTSPGRVTFNIFADDGWILGIGRRGGPRLSVVSGPRENAPAETPFTHLPVVGANNRTTAPVRNDVVVDFPAAGTFDFEIDYSECCSGQLALTLTADTLAITTSESHFEPVIAVIAIGVAVPALSRWKRSREQRRRRNVQERGFSLRVNGEIQGGVASGYSLRIRGANDGNSGG